ncbi:hypothetical protein NLJ89_g393 [Agrocybe chaxingu]|uniref:Uncharacterized protein n=1 Tax=Agrocybe chaxingu TaxID=84603 RepID=A0A9W8N1X0_9AGAR|nr:hypothetical protein NLJ89_g393 [Agrocybe chaxingu]
MVALFSNLLVVALAATSVIAQTFTINTPLNVVVCQPTLISWSGGVVVPCLSLQSILPAGQPAATPLLDLGSQTSTQVTWVTNLPVGTSGFFNLRDSTGALAQSGTFNILAGGDTSCVGQTASTSAGSGAPSTPNTSASAGTTTNTATGTSAANTSASRTSTGAATATSNASFKQVANVALLSLVLPLLPSSPRLNFLRCYDKSVMLWTFLRTVVISSDGSRDFLLLPQAEVLLSFAPIYNS